MTSTFEQELARFQGSDSIASAETPPSSWYLREDFLQRETEQVLLQQWQPVARLEELTNRGSFVSGTFLQQPWVVTRSQEGQLHAFYNVCRHHAALVAQGSGCAAQLTCPYHGWVYDLDGKLRKAPRLGAVREFQRDAYGLKPIALDAWGPWVWLNFGASPTPLCHQLTPLTSRVDPSSLAALRFVCRRSYTLECNWKVYVDNYLDGGYHVEVAHPGLAAQLDLDAYKTEILEPLVLQTCQSGGSGDTTSDFAERLGSGAVYAWLYPNWMFNRYGPVLDTNWVIPLGPERCETVFEYFFDVECEPEFIERSLEASHRVQLEDIEICESVQRGLRSRGYEAGRYAPALEIGEFAFHQWLARDLVTPSARGIKNH